MVVSVRRHSTVDDKDEWHSRNDLRESSTTACAGHIYFSSSPPSSTSPSPSHSHYLRWTHNMSFVLRRPFAVSSNAFKQFSKPSTLLRSFHSSPKSSNSFFTPRTTTVNPQSLLKSAALRNGFKRGYQTPSYQPANPTSSGNLTTRLLYGAALLGGTIVATNMIFNRETREDGGMPDYEREYLNQTFMHTGLGVGIIVIRVIPV